MHLFLPIITTLIAWLIIWAARYTAAFSTQAEGVLDLAIVLGYGGLWAAPAYIPVAVVIWILLGRIPTPRPVGLRNDGTIGDAAFQRLEEELDWTELGWAQLVPSGSRGDGL